MKRNKEIEDWKKCESCGKWFWPLSYSDYLCRDCEIYFERKITEYKEKNKAIYKETKKEDK